MKKTIKKILSGVLTLGMVVSLMPGMSMTAEAGTKTDKTIALTQGDVFKSGNLTDGNNSVTGKITASIADTNLTDGYALPASGSANATLTYTNTAESIVATQIPATIKSDGTVEVNLSSNPEISADADNDATFGTATLSLAAGTGFVKLVKVENDAAPANSPGLTNVTVETAQVTANKAGGGSGVFWTTGNKYSTKQNGSFDVTVNAAAGYEIGDKTQVVYTVDGGTYQFATVTKDAADPKKGTATLKMLSGDAKIVKVMDIIKVRTVVKGTVATEDITFRGKKEITNIVGNNESVEEKKDFTFNWETPPNVLIKEVTYTVAAPGAGTPVQVDDPMSGTFTIPGKEVLGNITIAATTVEGVKITVDADADPKAGVKSVKIGDETFTSLPASKVVEKGTQPAIVVVLDEAYEKTDDGIEVDDGTDGSYTSSKSLNLTAGHAVNNPGTIKIKGWQKLDPDQLATIDFSATNAKILDAETGEEVQSPKEVKKGSSYKVKVEIDEGATNLRVRQDGQEVGSDEGEYTINVPNDQEGAIRFAADAQKSSGAGDAAAGGTDDQTDDGKTDDGKTDDGKTDDGKTDDGKTDDGKTDDGAVTTNFADDADITDYAKPYVKAAADAGIVKGKENNRFDPKGGATRAEFATMIQRALGLKSDKAESRFSDVKAPLNEDLINGVLACEDIDPFIVEGYPDGTFQPGKQISRAEGILMIWRAVGRPAYNGANKFTDLQSWYATAANWAADQGIALGDGQGHFNGGALLTREDLATLLGRAIEKGIIKLPTAAADDKADGAKTDETKTDETKTEDGATDETKTDGSAAEGSSTEETKTEDTAA